MVLATLFFETGICWTWRWRRFLQEWGWSTSKSSSLDDNWSGNWRNIFRHCFAGEPSFPSLLHSYSWWNSPTEVFRLSWIKRWLCYKMDLCLFSGHLQLWPAEAPDLSRRQQSCNDCRSLFSRRATQRPRFRDERPRAGLGRQCYRRSDVLGCWSTSLHTTSF